VILLTTTAPTGVRTPDSPPMFRSVEEALSFTPDLQTAFEKRSATFDDLFYARYGYRPV